MARLLDQPPFSPRRHDPKTEETSSTIIDREDALEDLERGDVPFVEIGATENRAVAKPLTRHIERPATIPMPHAEPLPPTSEIASPVPNLYRVTFQALPLRAWPAKPGQSRVPPELVAFHQPNHAVSLQYRAVFNEIEQQLTGEQSRSLLFASLRPGAGTTSVLLNLAIICAKEEKHRVAVVDANLARPGVANRLGTPPAPGLREVLARTAPLMWAMQETSVPRLFVMAAGRRPELPSIDLWPLVLDHLQQRFDWIFIDGGEWSHSPEKPALLATATATYLVLGQSDLEMPPADELLTDISRLGGNLGGYVLVQN